MKVVLRLKHVDVQVEELEVVGATGHVLVEPREALDDRLNMFRRVEGLRKGLVRST